MKIVYNKTKELMPILAISWPTPTHLAKFPNFKTQFSAYDGTAVFDLFEEEFRIIDPTIKNFVFNGLTDDNRFYSLVWEPFASLDFWIAAREHDDHALAELKHLVLNMHD